MSTTYPTEAPPASRSGAPAVLEQVKELVQPLLDVLWAARPADEQAETVAVIAEVRSVLDAVELDVVRELDSTRDLQSLGWASVGDFVTAVSGGLKSQGPATVRLAEALAHPTLVPVADAMAEGWLSKAQAQVIARTVDELPSPEWLRVQAVEALLHEARSLDASDLRRAGRRLIETVDPDGVERRNEKAADREARSAHLSRRLSVASDGMGGAFIRGRCTEEVAALIRSVLMPLSRPVPTTIPQCDPAGCDVPGCRHDGRDPRDHGARMMDALEDALRLLQGTDVLPESHGAAPRINLTMTLDDLRGGTGFATTDTGEDLAPETARRMACDCGVVPIVLGGPSEVLDVGRHMRLASVAIWRALVARDRHCRFSGCSRPPVMCHAHHLQHWLDGGPTSLANLILLCGHHHRLVHSGPWAILREEDGFRFVPPEAVLRRRSPRPGQSPPDRDPPDG